MEMRAAASVGDLGVRRGFVDSVRFLLNASLKASNSDPSTLNWQSSEICHHLRENLALFFKLLGAISQP
jgi:hypothetical protein